MGSALPGSPQESRSFSSVQSQVRRQVVVSFDLYAAHIGTSHLHRERPKVSRNIVCRVRMLRHHPMHL